MIFGLVPIDGVSLLVEFWMPLESRDSTSEQQEFFKVITECKFRFGSTPWSIFSLLNLIGQVNETSALEFSSGEQITLLTHFIKPNIPFPLSHQPALPLFKTYRIWALTL